jgi:hypothetical protein
MSFPSSPINGQLATINGITYSYNSATNYWSRVPGGLGPVSSIVVTGTASSTSTTTGAVTIAGGLGVVGNINFGGNLYQNGTLFTGGGSSTGTTTTFTISNITPSTSTTTGALTVAGGVGVGGTIYAGSIVAGGVKTTSTSTPPVNPTVGDIWYNTLTDDIYRYTTDSVSSYWLDFNGPTANSVNVVKNLTIAQNVGGNVVIPVAVGTLSILNNSGSTVTVPVV